MILNSSRRKLPMSLRLNRPGISSVKTLMKVGIAEVNRVWDISLASRIVISPRKHRGMDRNLKRIFPAHV